ncbi:MAG: hypothetical protein DRJ64_02155 [Thermoprotei archaeon]|nr:MAG: hypothetical protein DRJ64_02155 [Thermoprotei archaeon]
MTIYKHRIVEADVGYANLDTSTTVASGSDDKVWLTPPVGYVYEIFAMKLYCSAITGASSGYHNFEIFPFTNTIPVALVQGNYNEAIGFSDSYIIGSHYQPDTSHAWGDVVRSLKASHDYPLLILYRNRTDVDHSETRQIRLAYIIRRI